MHVNISVAIRLRFRKVINLTINSLYMQNMLCILTAEMLLCSHLVPQGVPFPLDLALIACDHITQNKAACWLTMLTARVNAPARFGLPATLI